MSETKWTLAQQAAIDDRGGALLVSAAAGSGKTAVLTERAVRLITDPEHPVDADKLLIVTFTNAAAAELRARIGKVLLQRSQQQPANTALRRQRMLLQRAHICTIDAFCLDLLHKHFQALDVPPDFGTADSGTIKVLEASALAETLEAAYKNPDFCAYADLYGKGRTDNQAGQTILSVYNFLRAMPYYDKKLDEFITPWEKPNRFTSTCWYDMLLDEAARAADVAHKFLCDALHDLQIDFADARAEATTEKKLLVVNKKFAAPLEQIEKSVSLLAEIKDLACAKQWTPLYDKLTPYVLEIEPEPWKNVRPSGEHKDGVRARVKEAEKLFEHIEELISCSEDEAEADRCAALPKLRALFDAVRDYDTRFSAKKKERKLLEFSDFEHMALRLLCNPDGTVTELCKSVRQDFAAVMVDEYQDTNALQDTLYRCLASPSGDNLFLVGDLKQSIYRFRQADPSIFKDKMESWPLLPEQKARPRVEDGKTGQNAMLALDANFRSAPQVIEGINFIFEQLMTPQLGDTAYGDGQRLVCGAPGEYQGSVEAHFSKDDDVEADAAWVAERILQMVAAKEAVRDGSGLRPVQYGDCCILLSARANFTVYAEALSKLGIPVYADARENLLDAPHIRPLIALLRVIDNPAQDIYLAAVMLGPMFGFSDDDLVRLRAIQKKTSLYGAVLAVVNSEEQNDFVLKVKEFYARLTELRSMSRSVPIERLIEEIFVSTGYLAALGVMENGARRRDDARKFAAFCSKSGTDGISALIRAIDAASLADGAGQDASPSAAHPGCVTIMTIHRSKGLQFPVVILAETARKFNMANTYQPVLLHRVYGAGLKLKPEQGDGIYKTAAHVALAEATARELRSEQMRLLYVALTRAQDKLIMTVPLGIGSSTNALRDASMFIMAGAAQTDNEQASSFADWLRAALLVHPNGGALRTLAQNRELPFVDTKSKISIDVPQDDAVEDVPIAQAKLLEEEDGNADMQLVQKLRDGFAWQYPAQALADIPAKVSVTSIVHKAERTTLERPAFLSKDGLTAAEMGTALHAFLEHADFAVLAAAKAKGADAVDDAIAAEQQRQIDSKLTVPEIAEKLDKNSIHNFINSEAFARICGAEKVLREYAFITALPAATVAAAQCSGAAENAADEKVLVQGIADIVLIYPDHVELLDYKTDRRKTEQEFKAAYSRQLEIYAIAIDKRFSGRRVTYKALYSFALGKLIEV